MTMIAWTTGQSEASTAWKKIWPMPGQEKIASVTTAPANSTGMRRPIDGDDRDQRVADRVPAITTRSRSPLARAVRR